MDYVLTFRAEARDEMEDAYNWYEDQKATLGEDFLACVDTMLDRIEQRPEAYRVVSQDFRRAVIIDFLT
jgi:hypothetical protein